MANTNQECDVQAPLQQAPHGPMENDQVDNQHCHWQCLERAE